MITRELHGIKFTQNPMTGFFNLTEVVNNFNKSKSEKKLEAFLGSFFSRTNGETFQITSADLKKVRAIVSEGESCDGYFAKEKDLYDFLRDQSTKDFLVAVMKEEGLEESDLKQVEDHNHVVWGHSFLFVKLCCWLSPVLEVKAYSIALEFWAEPGFIEYL